jgi:uncharacterized membrane protein
VSRTARDTGSSSVPTRCLALAALLTACAPGPSDRSGEAAYAEAYRELVEENRALLAEETAALREELRLLHDERIASRRDRIELIADRHEGEVRAYDTIVFENRCPFVVSAAVHYKDLDDRWITRGWWNVDPGATVETDAKTRNSVLYLFAENRAASKAFDGDDLEDSTTESVVDSRFDQLDDDRWAYGEPRKVSFFRRDTGQDWVDWVETFECPLEAPLPRAPRVEASPPTDQPVVEAPLG